MRTALIRSCCAIYLRRRKLHVSVFSGLPVLERVRLRVVGRMRRRIYLHAGRVRVSTQLRR
jgi:hypothetical protein